MMMMMMMMMMMSILTSASASCSFYSYTPHPLTTTQYLAIYSEKPPSSPIKRAVNRVVEGVDSQVALSPRPATSLVNSDGTVKTADPADLTQELDFAAAAVSALLQAEACKTLSSFSSSQRSEIYR
jgi:hypothetical protein